MFDRKDFVRRVEETADNLQLEEAGNHPYRKEHYTQLLCEFIYELPEQWSTNAKAACVISNPDLVAISHALSADAQSRSFDHEGLIPLQVLMRLVYSMRGASLRS